LLAESKVQHKLIHDKHTLIEQLQDKLAE